jgi:hypothetical protein
MKQDRPGVWLYSEWRVVLLAEAGNLRKAELAEEDHQQRRTLKNTRQREMSPGSWNPEEGVEHCVLLVNFRSLVLFCNSTYF